MEIALICPFYRITTIYYFNFLGSVTKMKCFVVLATFILRTFFHVNATLKWWIVRIAYIRLQFEKFWLNFSPETMSAVLAFFHAQISSLLSTNTSQ